MPFHWDRKWNVVDCVDVEQLANNIVKHSWCCCVGFRCGAFLWLNDSTGEDGAKEWAVMREADGRQCETLTVGWCSPIVDIQSVKRVQERFVNGANPMFGEGQMTDARSFEHGETCELCA